MQKLASLPILIAIILQFTPGLARARTKIIKGTVIAAGTQSPIPGVTVHVIGSVGPSIQIRSATSFTGSNSPLIVIDGIPGGNLDLLQQDDIASFDILKDGSAAAIYGTQANGGVILITTKKGRSGPPRFYLKASVNEPDSTKPELGFREYSGKPLVFVDNIRQNNTLKPGQVPNSLPSNMTSGEEDSGVRFNKYKPGASECGALLQYGAGLPPMLLTNPGILVVK